MWVTRRSCAPRRDLVAILSARAIPSRHLRGRTPAGVAKMILVIVAHALG